MMQRREQMKELKIKLGMKLHPETRGQLFWLYTLLFIITVSLAYLPFFLTNTSLMFSDAILQHYETRIWLKDVVRQLFTEGSFSFWSWNIGLGADTLGALGYVYFDPFSYISALFPASSLSVGYMIEIFVQLYMAGLGFLYFGKITNMKLTHSLWGAFAYAFSSWGLLAAGAHSVFLVPFLLFPFIMAGVQKVLRGESPLPLILALVLSAATSIYFSFMTAIVVFLYLLVHFVKKEAKTLKNALCYWGKFVFYVGTAACLSAIVTVPVVYILMNAVKDSGTEYTLFHSLHVYVNYFSFLIGGQELFWQYATICVIPLFVLMIPSIFFHFRARKTTSAMCVFFTCLIFLLFPFFHCMFNGFGYPTGRWCYTVTFFYVWCGIQCIAEDGFNIRKYKKSIAAMLSVFGFVLIIIGRIVLKINNEITAITGVLNLAFAYIFYQLLSRKGERKRWRSGLVMLAIMCNIIAVCFVKFVPGISTYINKYAGHGEIYGKLETATQRAGTEIDDDSFYRIDQIDHISGAVGEQSIKASSRQVHPAANETLVFHTRSIYTYLSTTTGDLFDFYRLVGNNASFFRRICTYSNDNRTRLDFLTGVKYFLGNNPGLNVSTGANEYASYGFSPFKKSGQGVDIFQNKYAVGLGCMFDSYITETEWQKLDYPDREQALMQCVVLPDGQMTDLPHADVEGISSGYEKSRFKVNGISGLAFKNLSGEPAHSSLAVPGKIKVTRAGGGFTLHLDQAYPNCEMYLVARNLRRDPDSTKQMRYSAMNMLDRMRADLTTHSTYADYGGFAISASSGGISKKALNTVGSVNGLSNIKDYMINLGQLESKDIKVSLNTIGEYSYDAIELLAVPLSTYESCAAECVGSRYNIDRFSDNHVSGTVSSRQPASMLYVSIPYNDGWRAYVDGEEIPAQKINRAFTGIPVKGVGEHKVELRYRPVGFQFGVIAGFARLVFCAGIVLWQMRSKRGYKAKDNMEVGEEHD